MLAVAQTTQQAQQTQAQGAGLAFGGLAPASAQNTTPGQATQSPNVPSTQDQTGTGAQSQTTGAQGQGATTTNGNQPLQLQSQQPFQNGATGLSLLQAPPRPPPKPGEFENYVARVLNHRVPRFGAEVMSGRSTTFAPAPTATVPPDYAINPGDELLVQTSGSVESNLRLVVDSDGRIFIPRVGAIQVAGVRYGDLQSLLTERVGRQFRNFTLSAAIGRLHGVRVYVTGYAAYPGAYTVNSLSTLVNAVMAAGGPAAGGSFRNIELRQTTLARPGCASSKATRLEMELGPSKSSASRNCK